MTLDDLVKVYNDTVVGLLAFGEEKMTVGEAKRVAIRNIVEALRDELAPKLLAGLPYNITDLRIEFDDILGGAGDQAAGSGLANPSEGRATAPAADPSKACRWMGHVDGVFWSAHGMGRKLGQGQTHCEDCGGMIRLEPHKPDHSPQCKWVDYVRGSEPGCAPEKTLYSCERDGDPCPSCGKPIRFLSATKGD